jgi:hypothetical protein
MTVVSCVLYAAPVMAMIVVLRREQDGPLALACAIPMVFAADFLATFALCYVFRVEQAAFVRTGILVVLTGAILGWRAFRHRPLIAAKGALGRADLGALALALALGFCLSHYISSRYWISDREWHTPFTAALRVQRMPFRNVYEPAKTLRYHLSGDLFAAILQSLSFATMNASRALSIAHDVQSALLFGTTAMILRATTTWSPSVAALASGVPYLCGPIGLFHGNMGVFEGFSDFNNLALSFRPHCQIALLLLTGIVARVMALARGVAHPDVPTTTRDALALLPVFALASITDEISTALTGLMLAALWLRWPILLAPRRWQGAAILAGLALAAVVTNLFLAGTIAPGGPVEKTHWVAPRLPHFIGKPLPLGFDFESWKQFFIDEGALLVPAAVMASVVIGRRRQATEPLTVAVLFSFGLLAIGLVLFLCFEMNDRIYEGHRYMTAARVVVPIVALAVAPTLERASLRSVFLLGPIFAAAVVSIGYVGDRLAPRISDTRGFAAYDANCRTEHGARLGEPIVPTYVDEPFFFPYAGCRPIFAAGHDGPPGVVLAGWPRLGPGGFAKMTRETFVPGAPARVVCPRAGGTAVCRRAQNIGSCGPEGTAVTACAVPPSAWQALAQP